MNRILSALLCLSLFFVFASFAQNSDDLPWEIMMFQDDVEVSKVVQKFNAEWEGKEYVKGAGIKPFRRWEYLNSSRTNEQGKLVRSAHVTAFRTWLNDYSPQSNDNRSLTCPVSPTGDWKSTGPNRAVENYGIGRINAIAFHPTDPNQLWAAAPSGGIWISYNYGETWSTFTDDFATLGFSDIVFNPLNPNTIYVATGDKDSGDAPSIGVLKTTDGGLNWSVVYSTSSRIHRLIVNPTDTNIVLAATSSGIQRTTNGGSSWVEELSNYVRHMEFKPGNPSVVYASEYADNAEFYRSVDGGNNWSVIALPAVANTPRRLAIGVTLANDNIVYLSGGYNDPANSNDFAVLYKSTNGGASFTTVGGTPTLGSQYWYDWTIAVSPTNADLIFTGGLSLDKSTNGGATWTNNGTGVHVDHHFAGYHPITGDIFVGSDGGVYYSSNNGTTWNFVNKGMSIAQYYRLSTSDTEGDFVIMGAQDNGTHIVDGGAFDRVNGGDGMECIISHSNPNTVYAEYQRGIIRRSTNKGLSFQTIFQPSDVGEVGNWVTPYIMHPTNSNVLYAGFNNVHKSTDGGTTWSNSSDSLSPSTLTILAISDSNPNYVYAGRSSGLWRTTNGGTSWSPITSPPGTTRYIVVDPDNSDMLYAASSFDVYQSVDGGSSWSNISGTLPSIPMTCIEMQRGPNNPLYIGTDFGVYYKDDSLGDWILFSNGLPNVIISELEIDECLGMIRAASYGRGIWESPLYCTDVGTLCCDQVQPQLTPSFNVIYQCSNTVALTANPGPVNYNIQWFLEGAPLSGATDLSYDAALPGEYTYQLINPMDTSCNSQASNAVNVAIVCPSDSSCSDLNPNTDNGTGNITQLNISGSFDDLDSNELAVICISVEGDFSFEGLENFTIYDEGGIARGLTKNKADCTGRSEEHCFVVTSSEFNTWNDDDSIIINLDPVSSSINPTLCATNQACMRLFLPSNLDPCPPNDNLYIAGIVVSDTYRAAININSDGQVNNGADVIFDSGDNIDLNEEFEVQTNAEFEAKITPCISTPSSLESGGSFQRRHPLHSFKNARMKF